MFKRKNWPIRSDPYPAQQTPLLKKEKPKRRPRLLKQNKLYSTSQAATLLFPKSLTQSLLIQTIRTTAPYLSRLQLKSCFQHYTQVCTTDSCDTKEFQCHLVNLDNSYFLAEVQIVKTTTDCLQKCVVSANNHAKCLTVSLPEHSGL